MILTLTEILDKESIDIKLLQKGLRHLGLVLAGFDKIQDEQIPGLIELFKIVLTIDPVRTPRVKKMELRSKITKLINSTPLNYTKGISETIEEKRQPRSVEQNGKTKSFSDFKDSTIKDRSITKHGKVKFFDSTKGFGYLNSFDDKRDCFMHISKMLTSSVIEDDIVIFETVNSRKKPGELDAVKISSNIPVFIYNQALSSKSFLLVLLENHITKSIQLTGIQSTGFSVVRVRQNGASWKVIATTEEKPSKKDTICFGKKILANLMLRLGEYFEAIKYLNDVLKEELPSGFTREVYFESAALLERKSIPEIYQLLTTLIEADYFEQLIEKHKSSLNKLSFVLWMQGKIEKLPEAKNREEENIWLSEIIPSLDFKTLLQVLLRLVDESGVTKQIRASYKFLLDSGCQAKNLEDFESLSSFLKIFINKLPEIEVTESSFKFEYNEFYVTLFQRGILRSISNDRIKKHIESFNSNDEKATFIEAMPSSEILNYYSFFPELKDHSEKYIAGILGAEFSKFNFVCFDLESDGNNIIEYAWKTNTETKSQKDFEKAEEGISELIGLINSGCLVVGQNIKEYDLPILQHFGASHSSDNVWDTLEIEMILNPSRFSYGLKTKHTAAADTDLTLQLFINQVSRIIVSESEWDQFVDLLPVRSNEIFNTLKSNSHWDSLNKRYFEDKSNEFFRPNPSYQNISESSLQKLTENLKYDGKKALIAPEIIWSTLAHRFNLSFYSDNKDFAYVLSEQKIELVLEGEKTLKAILLRFIQNASLMGIKPFFQHLPIAIRLKLRDERAASVCDYNNQYFESDATPVCIRPTDIGFLKDLISNDKKIRIIVIGNELYDLTSKMQLGQDLDFATIFDRLKNEPIWLQLSGGKSFICIERRQCELLGIHDFPEYTKNIWLEKVGKGKFRIWCNINLESAINDLPAEEVKYIDWIEESIIKNRSYLVRPDIKKSAYIAEQKRVNPESLYRKIYWIYQFKLIKGIENSVNPKVLIVNDELEIDRLTSYARRIGYFIPDTNASLARQLEILHENSSSHKLLITTFQTLDKVINYNYAGALDYVWDSFLLQEKMQMMKGSIEQKIEADEAQSEDNFNANLERSQKDFDLFSLIKLHKPLIDYYYKILIDNNHDSNLYLCDSRLSDFYGIEKSLSLYSKNVRLWSKESEYEADRKIAAEFFPHSPENADTDFNIEEAKEILRNIFLTPDEGGLPFEWYSYQHPCLNEILPANKDLLISLPTGAGKSVLFQGPALFRSAFSCKLSIIISPLRALMQDQVDALWSKGFYSNVEFLSSDKSHVEIRDIYRRIAGGEIALLYITPERFRSRSFENSLLSRLDADNGLEFVVFDEAHCISQWGQEFRPDYLNAGKKVAGYSKIYQLRKLLFSATISEQVFEEISLLIPGVVTVEGAEKSYNPVRDHIKMDFKHNVVEDERLNEIANYLNAGRFNPSLSRAIVFVKSRKKVEECALIMSDNLKEVFGEDCTFSERVGAFHAGMDAEDRKETYEKFKNGEIVLLFSTKAFGMGMDIPNIHFVTHYSPPSTFEDFLQEVGRAGRNEKQRIEAGFNSSANPIRTLCLTTSNDFARLKDQLHQTRISWQEIKDIKVILEEYISRFKPLIPDEDIPVAVPFNLYSSEKGSVDDDLDNKFRLSLHWLERLERIKLGYFTITHLEFQADLLKTLGNKLNNCPDKDIELVCRAILNQTVNASNNNEVVQISIASLRNISKLSLENLFSSLIKAHNEGYIRLLQDVLIEPTKIRSDETSYFSKSHYSDNKYPALRVIFSFAGKIMNSIQANSSKFFDGDELDEMLKESIDEVIDYAKLPWSKKDKEEAQEKEKITYIKDINKKRSKHAFTVIRLLGKTKHETIKCSLLSDH